MLGLAAILGVVIIISSIRLVADGSGSAQSTPTTTTRPASSLAHHGSAPISAAELAQFEGYAEALQKANAAATKGFVSAGSTPTPTSVAAAVTPYRAALNLYYFQLHFIHWPASMQTAVETDQAQLQALISFLGAFDTVSPTGVSAWLSQVHNRTGTTQAADNQVRQDIGLTVSSSFP